MSNWVVRGYTEERELGRGASSRVVAAVHNESGQRVAIKYLSPRLLRDPDFVARFREEVEVLRSLDVPEVVRLFDYAESPGHGAAIIMELVDGVSLHDMITRQGPTSPESALVVLMGSLLGLASAHEAGIVHRDYKPENVLVDRGGHSKLTDFGIAVRAGDKSPAEGTPLYMAPEQWAGAPASPATDIYAAAAVFFECLTGRTPYTGRLGQLAQQHQTAAIPVAQVPPPLQSLITRGMAKDPRDRPAHAVEFVAELIAAADGTYGPGWEERGRDQLAQRSAALLLLLLGGIAGAAGSSFAATLLGGAGRRKRTVIAGVAVGLAAVIGVTTVTLALAGRSSHSKTADPPATSVTRSTPSSGRSGTGSGSPTASSSASQSPTASTSASPSPTTSMTTSPGATTPATTQATGKATSPATTGAPTTGTPATTPVTTTAPVTTPATTPATTSPPSSPKATPPPVLSVSASPATDAGACPATLPTLSVPGTISSTQATTVTYLWVRSDGTSSTPVQVPVPKGGTVNVADTVTAASNQWTISDTLEVTSPSAQTADTSASVTCTYPALTLENPGTQFPVKGEAFSLTLDPAGGSGAYTWTQGGTLPAGLTFADGVISGTPTVTGRFSVTIGVTDDEADPQTASVTFIIDPLKA